MVGDPSVLAVESRITRAYERLSFRAIGYFVIHVGGRRYGVQLPEASMLVCSFDSVARRIARRGEHAAPFASGRDAGLIADAVRRALYADGEERELFFGIPRAEFSELIYSKDIVWAPDGDEAFDDHSCVLQFDVRDRVRLIAFKSSEADYSHDHTTLTDVWLPADDFYKALQNWHDAFEDEWTAMPKVAEA
jgi:hypothetical protein